MRSVFPRASRLFPALAVAATTTVALCKASPAQKEEPKTPAVVNVPVDKSKHQLLVIGSGWGAVSFLRNLKHDPSTQVTVVSPRGVFLYTPLLPAATTGTVEARSIIEPIRRLLPKGARFVEASATDIDPVAKTVTCESALLPGKSFSLSFDTLVVAVGSVANTFGVPGVLEHCHFLKSYDDATGIRSTIHERWEQAALPTTTPEERKRLLTFVVCGAGPTGAELAAELQDLFTSDLAKEYPDIVHEASVIVIEANSQVLSMFDRRIADHATAAFSTQGIVTKLNTRVVGVTEQGVDVLDIPTNTKSTIPAATVVWATGVGMHPLASSLAAKLSPQTNRRALIVDEWLRVKGAEDRIFCVGDAASIEQKRSIDHASDLFDEFDKDGNGFLDVGEVHNLLKHASKAYPQSQEHIRLIQTHQSQQHLSHSTFQELSLMVLPFLSKVESSAIQDAFDAADKDGDHLLSKTEFVDFLSAMDKHLRAMPATAQVAKQQGKYLARLTNAGRLHDVEHAEPFHWKDYGSLAFIGADEAVANLPGIGILQGILTGLLWRGFETSGQQSIRNRVAVASDQVRSKLFGRGV
ncbi:unnamed protein product [Aphanomyces euteiches]